MYPDEKTDVKKDDLELLLAIIQHVGSENVDFKAVAELVGFEGTQAVPPGKGLWVASELLCHKPEKFATCPDAYLPLSFSCYKSSSSPFPLPFPIPTQSARPLSILFQNEWQRWYQLPHLLPPSYRPSYRMEINRRRQWHCWQCCTHSRSRDVCALLKLCQTQKANIRIYRQRKFKKIVEASGKYKLEKGKIALKDADGTMPATPNNKDTDSAAVTTPGTGKKRGRPAKVKTPAKKKTKKALTPEEESDDLDEEAMKKEDGKAEEENIDEDED